METHSTDGKGGVKESPVNNNRYSLRDIAALRLSDFEKPVIPGNRTLIWRAAWYICNALFFRNAILGLIPSTTKAHILRIFGAKVGRGFVCKPRVTIKYPWFLSLGDHVWVGEEVWIDNHCTVEIGSNVCISQGARIFTGNHDWTIAEFAFFCKPVVINDGVWVTAFQIIVPGTTIPAHVAVVA
jgi:putative colanic acid biosynthesis acetyltransferase WcaF